MIIFRNLVVILEARDHQKAYVHISLVNVLESEYWKLRVHAKGVRTLRPRTIRLKRTLRPLIIHTTNFQIIGRIVLGRIVLGRNVLEHMLSLQTFYGKRLKFGHCVQGTLATGELHKSEATFPPICTKTNTQTDNCLKILVNKLQVFNQSVKRFSRRFMKWNATIIVTFFQSTRTDQNSSNKFYKILRAKLFHLTQGTEP